MQLFPPGTKFGVPSPFEQQVATQVDDPRSPSAFALMLSARAQREQANRQIDAQNQQLNAMSWAQSQQAARQKAAETALDIVKQAESPGSAEAVTGSTLLAPYLQGVDLTAASAYAKRAAESEIISKAFSGVGKAVGEGVMPDMGQVASATGYNLNLGVHPSVAAAGARGRAGQNEVTTVVPLFGPGIPPGAQSTVKHPLGVPPSQVVDQLGAGMNVAPPRARQPAPNQPASAATVSPSASTGQGGAQMQQLVRAYARLPADAQRDAMDLAIARKSNQPLTVMRGGVPHVLGASGKEYPLQVQ